jgi:hypothetical protein
MTDISTPIAARLRRPSWRDARVLTGVLLILVSTAFGALAFARADDTVPMYAAAADLLPGAQLTAESVTRVDVHLGNLPAGYVPADTAIGSDRFALRAVPKGELIPASAVGPRAQVNVQAVTLQVDATSAGLLKGGSVVDVYVNRPKAASGASSARREYAGPERTLEAVHVAAVPSERGVLGVAANMRAVQLLVPRDEVAAVVADVDAGAKITLVPAPGSVRAEGS